MTDDIDYVALDDEVYNGDYPNVGLALGGTSDNRLMGSWSVTGLDDHGQKYRFFYSHCSSPFGYWLHDDLVRYDRDGMPCGRKGIQMLWMAYQRQRESGFQPEVYIRRSNLEVVGGTDAES